MAERIGICQGCNSRYRIPPTFAGTKARCKKCGGVVQVTEEVKAPAAPAPTAAAGGDRKRAGKTRGAAGSQATGRRGRAAEPAASGRSRGGSARKSNTGILIAAGILVVAGGGGLFYMLKGGDKDTPTTASAATSGNEAATEAAGTEDASGAATPGAATPAGEGAAERSSLPPGAPPAAASSDAAPAGSEAAPGNEPAATAVKTDEPAAPAAPAAPAEEVVTLLQFDAFGPNEGTAAEDWTAISEAVEGMKYGGKGRKRSMDSLKEYGLAAVPALINTFNGLDLTDSTAWRDAYEVALFIQDTLTFGTIQIPFKGDYSEDPAVVSYNVKALNSLVKYWRERQGDPALLQRTQELFEEKKAAAGNG